MDSPRNQEMKSLSTSCVWVDNALVFTNGAGGISGDTPLIPFSTRINKVPDAIGHTLRWIYSCRYREAVIVIVSSPLAAEKSLITNANMSMVKQYLTASEEPTNETLNRVTISGRVVILLCVGPG